MAGRMTERRVIRRAADDALMAPRRLPDDAEEKAGRLDDDRDFPPGFGAGRRDNRNVAARADISVMAGGYRNPPWRQPKWLLAAVAIAVIVVLAVWGIIGVLRSPDNARDGSPAETPPTAQSEPASAPVEGRSGEPILVGTTPAATAEQLRPR